MRRLMLLPALLALTAPARAQVSDEALSGAPMARLTQTKDYVLRRASSYDRTGGNADYRTIAPGETLTLMDEAGPGVISHVWITIASPEAYHLKKLVLRMYWDETSPSVEAPLGDYFGLGLGNYFLYQSTPLAGGSDKALNSFFPMPFQKHARITVTNEGQEKGEAFYFNIDYRALSPPLRADTLYFHAQYRQATPCKAIKGNGLNVEGQDNYVWMEATGRGHFVGVTMSVMENADGWWGEGDDMFFVDGERTPSINGTGSEDYFLGAWGFTGGPFAYALFGAPVQGPERAGARWSVYRFHLDSPITFTKSLRATIEHGHANDRADDYDSVAYWYQTEPHAAFPPMPLVDERLPKLHPAGR